MKNNPAIEGHRLWTLHYILIMLVSFLISIAFNMLNNILPLYALHIGGNISLASMMTGLFSLTALIFRPIFGNMLDRIGRKQIFIGGMMTFILIGFSYNFASTAAILILVRVLQGISFSAYSTASGTIVSDIVPPKRLMEGIGLYGISNTLALSIGPAIALSFVKNNSYHVVFVLTAILGIVGVALAMKITYKDHKSTVRSPKIHETGEMHSISIIEKTSVPTGIIVFFTVLSAGCVLTFLPAFALTRGIKNIGIYYTVNAVALLISRLFMGKVTDRYGHSRIMLPAMLLLIGSLIQLALAKSLAVFLIAGFFNGLATGTLYPMFNSFVIKLCSADRRGIATATYFAALDIGVAVGALAGSVIIKLAGYPVMFITSALCVVFGMAEYIFVLKKQLDKFEMESETMDSA